MSDNSKLPLAECKRIFAAAKREADAIPEVIDLTQEELKLCIRLGLVQPDGSLSHAARVLIRR